MTDTKPTRCGWAGQPCARLAIVQTWQTDARYGDVVTLDRPLCGYHLDMEVSVIQHYSTPTVLHIAALGLEVTR